MRVALVALLLTGASVPACAQQSIAPPAPDLSQFATTTVLNQQLSQYATTTQLTNAAASNLTAMQAANTAAGYVTAAQAAAAAPVQSVNGKTGAILTATVPGVFTVQNGGATPLSALNPTANPGRYANVSDLGGVAANGGAGYGLVYSNGNCWARFRTQVTPATVPIAASIPVAALTMSSTIQVTGSAFAASAVLNITGACQGDTFRLITPAGLVSTLGSLGVSINGVSALTIPALANATNTTWGDYTLNGTTVVKLAGGTL